MDEEMCTSRMRVRVKDGTGGEENGTAKTITTFKLELSRRRAMECESSMNPGSTLMNRLNSMRPIQPRRPTCCNPQTLTPVTSYPPSLEVFRICRIITLSHESAMLSTESQVENLWCEKCPKARLLGATWSFPPLVHQ